MIHKLGMIVLTGLAMLTEAKGQEWNLPLYTREIPYDNGTVIKELIERKEITVVSKISEPRISVYLPSPRNATGQAVIICPGGGYWVLAYDLEGTDIARYLNTLGVAAIVLKYRLPVYGNVSEPHRVPLSDAQRAMRLVRYMAPQWHIDSNQIGIMGFSAGGHLASTLGTHFDYGNSQATDPVEQISCRPDFMILMYPVITFTDPSMHKGSREALLGKDPDPELVKYYSNELQVTSDTPPAFFVHADDDTGVPVENSLLMYKALRANKVSAEMHILSSGGHGFGLGLNNSQAGGWTASLRNWLQSMTNISPKP